MDKQTPDIEALKASLSQNKAGYSTERQQADIQSLNMPRQSMQRSPRIVCDSAQSHRALCEDYNPQRHINFTSNDDDNS